MYKKNKKYNTRNYIFLSLAVVGIIGIAGAFYYFRIANNKVAKSDSAPTSKVTDKTGAVARTDLSPATPVDQKSSEQQKDEIVKQQNSPSPTQTSVAPVITFTGYQTSDSTLQVGAYMPGVVEDGGTCKLTATKGSDSVSVTTLGTRNASNTNCAFTVARSRLPSSGEWLVVVSYASSTIQSNNSQSQKVNIP